MTLDLGVLFPIQRSLRHPILLPTIPSPFYRDWETDMTTKTTPFTIALWDSFPADKKPKAVTKSNRLVRILCTDRLGDYPIIGLIENRMPESWDPATSDLFLLIPSFPPSPDGQTCPDLASTNTNHEPQRPMAKKKKGKGGKKGIVR